ncbi:MAG TPA: hypothetical protein VL098_04510 [Flavipsychrobacter sp.]|nr:hypothetical protein [Flavipsychrobacter sp.]
MNKALVLPFVVLFFLAGYRSANGQRISLFKSIPVDARSFTVDELGNAYVIRKDNTLLRYNEKGDSTGFYKTVLNGELAFVDATNPLRILGYFPGYFKIILLDRMLSLKNEMDLRKLHIANASTIASSADGNVWVYDRFNARLKKIDEQLNVIQQSNDLRQELQMVPTPVFMTERDWKVYLCDTSRGVFIFDRYGNYVNMIPILHIAYLQLQGSKLIYRKDDSLYSWDTEKVKEERMPLPLRDTKILNATLTRDMLYVLYEGELVLYSVSED